MIVKPAKANPEQGIAIGICESCATDHAAAMQRGLEAVKRIWPDAKPLTVTHPEGGRA